MPLIRKITWVLLGSSALALVLLVLFLTETLQEFAVNQWIDRHSHSASQLSRLIDEDVLFAQSRLQLLAQQDAFLSPPDSSLVDRSVNGIPEGIESPRRKALNWLLAEKKHSFNVLFVLLPNGDHFLSHPYSVQKSIKTHSLAHRPYFQLASETGQPVISNSFIGSDGIPAVAILVPIKSDSGQVSSYLGGVFNLAHLTWLVSDFSSGVDHGSVFLLDEKGALIVANEYNNLGLLKTLDSPFVQKVLTEKSLEKESGKEYLKTGVVIPSIGDGSEIIVLSSLECGWTVGFISNLEAVSNHFQKPIWRTVGLFSILLLIVGGAIFILARYVGLHWQKTHDKLKASHSVLEQDIEERTKQLAVDVAAHQQTSRALLEREYLFDAITNQSAEGITVADTQGQYTFVNPAFCKMVGYTQAELLQMTVFEMKAKAQVLKFANIKSSREGVFVEVILKRKDGSEFHSEVFGKEIEIGETKAALGIVRDITDRICNEKEKMVLERQMQHSQKLESLGALAGGIAHDFNNLLMAILGNTDLALMNLSTTSPARENLREIERASRRAAELSRQMLAYSGKGHFVVEPINLGLLVEEIGHLLVVSISKKVDLKYNFEPKMPEFQGDVTQVRQIVLNLITNASEAIGDSSGVVVLSTGVRDCDQEYLDDPKTAIFSGNEEPLEAGLYCFLEVSDTGCGMDSETMHKVFDPFFTTKFAGRGLGMSAVQGIVRGHRGAIRVSSQVGNGTTFKILFRANETSVKSSDVDPSAKPMKHPISTDCFSGTVLIVDDEETIRAVGKQMLERLGFQVLTAADGQEGLNIFKQHSKEITCVLLDLTMPILDGVQAFGELRRMDPEIKVILCSGYNEGEATHKFSGRGLAGFIQKPYNLALLSEKLSEVLTHRQQAEY